MWAWLGLGALVLIGLIGTLVILDYDEPGKRKIAAVILIIAMLGTTVFIVYQTDFASNLLSNEFGGGEGGIFFRGYNPYENVYGGTNAEGDYDRDSISNLFDTDCDDDGVSKYKDTLIVGGYDCSPFDPDVGITSIEAKWVHSGGKTMMEIRVYPEMSSFKDLRNPMISIYIDGDMRLDTAFNSNPTVVEFEFGDDATTHNIYIKTRADYESKYANKANNMFSYTLPAGFLSQIMIGDWYSNLERTIQGIIRNNPLPDQSGLDSFLRTALASAPLWIWMVAVTIFIIWVVWWRRRKEKKPRKKRFILRRIIDKFLQRKPPHRPGDVEIRTY